MYPLHNSVLTHLPASKVVSYLIHPHNSWSNHLQYESGHVTLLLNTLQCFLIALRIKSCIKLSWVSLICLSDPLILRSPSPPATLVLCR